MAGRWAASSVVGFCLSIRHLRFSATQTFGGKCRVSLFADLAHQAGSNRTIADPMGATWQVE